MSIGVKLYTYLQLSLQIVIVPVLGHTIETAQIPLFI